MERIHNEGYGRDDKRERDEHPRPIHVRESGSRKSGTQRQLPVESDASSFDSP